MTSEYLQASGEIKKLISKEAPTSKKMHISCDVHPIAVMLGVPLSDAPENAKITSQMPSDLLLVTSCAPNTSDY